WVDPLRQSTRIIRSSRTQTVVNSASPQATLGCATCERPAGRRLAHSAPLHTAPDCKRPSARSAPRIWPRCSWSERGQTAALLPIPRERAIVLLDHRPIFRGDGRPCFERRTLLGAESEGSEERELESLESVDHVRLE